jgi:WD40 repeat protein
LDRWIAPPSGKLPASLKRHLRWSSILVFVCTEHAVESEFVKYEIGLFSKFRRKVIPIDVDGAFANINRKEEPWSEISGASSEEESRESVLSGRPSEAVIERILKSIEFTRQDQRLRRAVWSTLAFILLSIGGALIYSNFTIQKANAEANAAKVRAQAADEKAVLAEARAKDADAKTILAESRASTAEAKATEEEGKALDASARAGKADESRRQAEVAANKARQQEVAAKAETHKQQELGASSRLANQSQLALRREPDYPARSVSYAVASMQRAASVGFHSLEADMALREGLALLPRFYGSRKYEGDIVATALSPDAKFLATLRSNGASQVKTLNVCPTGETVLHMDVPCINHPINENTLVSPVIALSNDAQYAAVAAGGDIKFYDLTNERSWSIINPQDFPDGIYASSLALSPDAKYVAAIKPTIDLSPFPALLLDVQNRKLISKSLNPSPSERESFIINDVAFSSDGKSLILGGSVIDAAFRKDWRKGHVVMWKDPFPGTSSMSGYSGGMEEFDLDEPIRAIAYDSEQRRFATAHDNVATVWEGLGQPVARMKLKNNVERLAFDSNGSKMSVVRDIPKSDDNGARSASLGKTLEVWDATGLRESVRCQVYHQMNKISFGLGGNIFMVDDSSGLGTVQVKRINDCKDIGSEIFGENFVQAVTFTSPDFTRIVRSRDGEIRVWKLPNGIPIVLPKSDLDLLGRQTSFTPDGKFMALEGRAEESDSHYKFYAVIYESSSKGYEEKRRWPLKDYTRQIALSSDGSHLVILNRDGTVYIMLVSNGTEVTPDSIRKLWGVSSIKISPKGQYLATLIDHETKNDKDRKEENSPQDLQVWKLADGVLVNSLRHDKYIKGFDFSSDERFLGTGSKDGTAQILDLSGLRLDRLEIGASVLSVAFSLDGRYFGIGTEEGISRVYEAANITEVTQLQHDGAVNAIAFSRDNRYVATTSNDVLRVWLLQQSDLIKNGSDRLRALSNNSFNPTAR